MRRLLLIAALGLGLAGPASAAERKGGPAAPKEGECGSFGTAVEFVDTPRAAAAQARKEQKLVFVLHVSGNFENPRFT